MPQKETVNPDVLDVLIVGGGPAGTAAAFRAKELGLSLLVVDRDEVLSLLRDWISPDGNPANDKPVDSAFGHGGERVPFPLGDDLVATLRFENQVPASELYNRWIKVYDQGIPRREDLDLLSLDQGDGGIWSARCFSQKTSKEERIQARTVVLALGRGKRPNLGILGNTKGITYNLVDARRYLGAPACVIGGGTSAAEAVIAISLAKAEANDDSEVYWVYRSRKLPKVNSTLAEKFFKAYLQHGNITYLPFSDPLAVLDLDDGKEVIAMRCERRQMAGRPAEGRYLEFPKEHVIACIGAEIPKEFLKELGISLLKPAKRPQERMAVSPLFESQLKNVFIAGDLLTPEYIQTTDFSPGALQTTVITHIGNFKQGMTDGVLAIEAVKKRLGGASDGEIAASLVGLLNKYGSEWTTPPGPLPTKTPLPAPPQVGARFVSLLEKRVDEATEWVEDKEFFFSPGTYTIGRNQGHILFPDDDQVADQHVAILVDGESCTITGQGMQGKSWLDVRVERTIEVGAKIYAGDQRLQLVPHVQDKDKLALALLDAGDNPEKWLTVTEDGRIYGSKNSDKTIVINADDRTLSRRHFYLEGKGNVIKLRDFGSLNHTYLEVTGPLRLNVTDEILFGKQRLRFKAMETGVTVAPPPDKAKETEAAPPEPSKEKEEKEEKEVVGGVPAVRILNSEINDTFPLGPDQSLLEKFIEQKLATKKKEEIKGRVQSLYSCKAGDCGRCLLKVISGSESLFEVTEEERNTIPPLAEDLRFDVDYNKFRLACMTKTHGPVEVKLLGNTEA